MNQLPLFAATYQLVGAPPNTLLAGEALLLAIELRNTGVSPWLASGPYPARLGYRWHPLGGGPELGAGGRALLPGPVPPGMSARVELRVEAPPAPGRYRLEIELVEEGLAWLSQRGVAPFALELEYAPAAAPRVAILNGNVVANDAVGGHIVAQLRTLRAAGYHTMLLTRFVDERLPADVRRSMAVVTPDELRQPNNTSAAAEHLRRADIVIVNYSSYYDLAELIREIRRGVIIFDYHGVTPPELWGREWPGYEDLVRGRDNLSLVRYADYAVGHSQFTCDELIATGLIAPSRVRLMPYAVIEGADYAGPPAPEVVERFGLAGRHVLLYVGRMARNKRVLDLVEALPAIKAQHPNIALLLVGDNKHEAYRNYSNEVRARAAALDVADDVIFTGQVDAATLESCYRACALFVTASVHEGFCMPVVEAMARGRPVVAADTTALPGTLAGAGLLFRPQDPADLAAKVVQLLDGLPAPGDHSDPLAIHRPAPASDAELAALRERPIGVVAPRYGPQVLGGAESGIRSWAEQLAARGYRVEALTTCTLNMGEWVNHLRPGVEQINGVTVRRFSTSTVDMGVFHTLLQRANRGERLRYNEEQRFMANNLRSAELERHIAERASEYSCLLYTPYLFGTSYWPSLLAPENAVMLPCLHDEPSARLELFREMLERSAALFFNADPESVLASETLHVANPYRTRIGYGFPDQPPVGDAARFRAQTGIEAPFLFYAGRLEHAKNVPLLLEYFARYKAERPGPLALVLTGNGGVPVPTRPDVIALGMLAEHELLIDGYAAALALCQPSHNESFSIVLMDAWQQGRPALIPTACAVTRDHVEKSGGGYLYADYEQFRAGLDALQADPAHADALGERGRAYVEEQYGWSHLLERMERSIAQFSRPRSLYARLAQRGVTRALAFTRQRFEDELLQIVGQAGATSPAPLAMAQQEELRQQAQVARPGYQIRSGLPLVGPAVAWLRRQLTSHLKEPYLDPVFAEQERFNRELLDTLLPALDASQREQRRLRAELDLLRERQAQKDA